MNVQTREQMLCNFYHRGTENTRMQTVIVNMNSH